MQHTSDTWPLMQDMMNSHTCLIPSRLLPRPWSVLNVRGVRPGRGCLRVVEIQWGFQGCGGTPDERPACPTGHSCFGDPVFQKGFLILSRKSTPRQRLPIRPVFYCSVVMLWGVLLYYCFRLEREKKSILCGKEKSEAKHFGLTQKQKMLRAIFKCCVLIQAFSFCSHFVGELCKAALEFLHVLMSMLEHEVKL